ncbi:MBL fold metallo-hydrolase [Nocardioides halotolerans]|uniref:MBL fold metallo-hydrolase n=1 Tax=Nocardioides halotolerans TaxID=433660 RepID=UPI000428F4A4|nr:MBL fold metallo-hydrolase [Nocardioides halotolerans]
MTERLGLGGATITALLDAEGPFFLPLSEAFPDADADLLEGADRLDPDPRPAPGRWWLAFRVHVVEVAGRVVLVDTGAASDTPLHSAWAPSGPHLADRLADELDVGAEQVTDVVLTHLHGDHAAGSIDHEGRPAFPAATYHLQTREIEAVRAAGEAGEHWRQLLDPLAAADQLHACEGAVALAAGPGPAVELRPTPGHTPGHQSVLVSGAQGRVLVAGDVFTHALQVLEPASRYVFDQDHDEAVRTRQEVLESVRTLGAALGTAHLHTSFVRV